MTDNDPVGTLVLALLSVADDDARNFGTYPLVSGRNAIDFAYHESVPPERVNVGVPDVPS